MAASVSPTGNTFQEVKIIGNGAFGSIRLCKTLPPRSTPGTKASERLSTAQKCVVKKVPLARQPPRERFASVQELAMMLQLRHRNLIHTVDAWLEGKHTACLAMEHYEGGDLSRLLAARKNTPIHEEDVCVMLVQVRTLHLAH